MPSLPFHSHPFELVGGLRERPGVRESSVLVNALGGLIGLDVPEKGIPSSREHHLTDV